MLSTVTDVRAMLKLRTCPVPLRCSALQTLVLIVQAFMRLGMGSTHQDESPIGAKRLEVAKAMRDCHATVTVMLAPKEDALVNAEAYRLLGWCCFSCSVAVCARLSCLHLDALLRHATCLADR
jgi:hypothetical protein